MERLFFGIGSLLAGLAVAAGAFAAHTLEGRLDAEALAVYEVAVRYQMYHALALLAVAWACDRWGGASLRAGGWLLVAGTAVFSGSLYLLMATGARWWGAVTPFGGVALLAGWAALAAGVWRAAR